jgi:hypothetical protein
MKIKYIKNANKTYPQWHNITVEITEIFKKFHKVLRADGYNIKSCNIAEKDKKLFWILLTENGKDFKLEQYGTIL